MFDRRYPWIAVTFLTLVATAALLYYAAIVSGLYKDPMMSRFRSYGAERRYYPFCRFLEILGGWGVMVASMLDALTVRTRHTNAFAPTIFLALAFMALAASVVNTVQAVSSGLRSIT